MLRVCACMCVSVREVSLFCFVSFELLDNK